MPSKKRLLPLGFIALVLAIVLGAVANDPAGAWQVVRQGWDHPTALATAMEEFFRENLPFRQQLRNGVLRLRMAGGSLEQDGLFLLDDSLIPNLQVTSDTTIHRGNTRKILEAIRQTDTPAYFLLLPTACAIYADDLPSYLPLYNQRNFIESTYQQFYGSAVTVDAYNALLYSDSDYLFYRTEDSLAPLGGYEVYQALASRLGFTEVPLQQYEVSYLNHQYYGDLYEQWGYGGVRPDVITAYRDTTAQTQSQVLSWDRYSQKTYGTLYPQEAAASGEAMDAVLGGYAPRIEIRTLGARESSLLVLGDHTALSYLPFLAGHYERITFLDLSLLTASEMGEFNPGDYSQVLFAYSLETYLNSDSPAKVSNLTFGARGETG
jgi:hypothetical protein